MGEFLGSIQLIGKGTKGGINGSNVPIEALSRRKFEAYADNDDDDVDDGGGDEDDDSFVHCHELNLRPMRELQSTNTSSVDVSKHNEKVDFKISGQNLSF